MINRITNLLGCFVTMGVVSSVLYGATVTTNMAIKVDPISITPGGSAKVTATVTPNTGTISCGKGQIQYRIYDATNAVRVDWTQLANNLSVTANEFFANFDTTVIPVVAGERVSFRAGYSSSAPGGGCEFENQAIGQTLTVDLTISPEAPSAFCPNNQTTGVFISIEGPNGNGMPAPGASGPWSFNVKVTACENVYDVSAQGGANGWASAKSFTTLKGSVTESVKNKNTVYLWSIGDLLQGQQANLQIEVNSTIKNTAGECGKVKLLNGDWSALYAISPGGMKTKSAYTQYTSTVQVTCQ